MLVSRTGYTGEDGFEIVGSTKPSGTFGTLCSPPGGRSASKPCGLGARDTLRTEVCYPLYGHELDEQTTPHRGRARIFSSRSTRRIHGRSVLMEQKIKPARGKNSSHSRWLGNPRRSAAVSDPGDGANAGVVTSGTQGPSLGIGIGMVTCRRSLRSPIRRLKLKSAANRLPPSLCPSRFIGKFDGG